MGGVDGGRGGAPVNGRQPACVAVGENVDRLSRLLARGYALDDVETVAADALVDGDVLIRDLGGTRTRRGASRASSPPNSKTAPPSSRRNGC